MEIGKFGIATATYRIDSLAWKSQNVEFAPGRRYPSGDSSLPNSAAFEEDVKILKDYVANRNSERRRTANPWQDVLSTYTFPGHWRDFASCYIFQYKINTLRSVQTLAYLDMAKMDGGISCWDAKYCYRYPRPI